MSSQQSHTFRSRIVQAKIARHSNMSLCKFNANYLQVPQQYAVCSNTGWTVINMVFCVHPRLIEATPREIDMTPVRVTVSKFTTSKKRWVLMKVDLFIYSNTISPLTAWQLKLMTVGNIAQKPKDITVNWNIPFWQRRGWSILNLSV